MLLKTKHFGEIDYDVNSVITFEEGLPGFRSATEFILLADDPGDLFHWLQSIDNEDLAFVLMDVKQVLADYDPIIEPGAIASLTEGKSLEDDQFPEGSMDSPFNFNGPSFVTGKSSPSLRLFNIAVVPDDLTQMRVNLKAPIIINERARKGKQVIASNEEYGVRHYIFEEMSPASGVIGC